MINRYCIDIDRRKSRGRFPPDYFISRLRLRMSPRRRLSHDAIAVMACVLSGCLAPAVTPPADRISAITSVLVVPVEAPPLEVIPDLIETRMPVFGQYQYETVPSLLLMTEKIYRHPGGILIAGLVGSEDTVREAQQRASAGEVLESSSVLKESWVSTLVLAEQAASVLNACQVRAVMSGHFRRLPIAGEDRTANLGNWRRAVRDWYAQDPSSIAYRRPGVGPVDAVLEIGVGSYRIFEGQTSVQVLLKLIDAGTGRVIGRTHAEDLSVDGEALALLGHEGEKFKSVVTHMGTRLLTDGLNALGLAQDFRSGGIRPAQAVAGNGLR